MVVNKKGNSRYILYSHRIHLLIVPLKIKQNEVIVPTILVLPLFFPDEIRYRHTHKLILFIHTLIDQQYDSQTSLCAAKEDHVAGSLEHREVTLEMHYTEAPHALTIVLIIFDSCTHIRCTRYMCIPTSALVYLLYTLRALRL